jgi:GTP-binding protein
MDQVNQVAGQHRRRITTAELNRFFAEVCEHTPPPIYRGRAVRIHYLTQGRVRPPTFLLFTSAPEGLSPQYKRFVANQLRKRYGFRGTPLRVVAKAKSKPKKK